MIETRICPVCEGAGTECNVECWVCNGEGVAEIEILNDKSIRRICNSIQDIIANTNISISDNEIIEFLNSHKRD